MLFTDPQVVQYVNNTLTFKYWSESEGGASLFTLCSLTTHGKETMATYD